MPLDGLDAGFLRAMYGPVMPALGEAARGMVLPDEGCELLVADYAAVEARVLFWMVNDQSALDIFRDRSNDIYTEMAGTIYGAVPLKGEPWYDERRFMGKQSILGLGYGMGLKKFIAHVARLTGGRVRVTHKEARRVVKVYRRERFPLVPEYWAKTQEAATDAILDGGPHTVDFGGPAYTYRREELAGREFLSCEQPSGSKLWYRKPGLEKRLMFFFKAHDPKLPVGEREKETVTVTLDFVGATSDRAREKALESARSEGLELLPDKPGIKETFEISYFDADGTRPTTYGGKLVENNDQKTSRDLLAHSIMHLKGRTDVVRRVMMTVHDELVSSAPLLASRAEADERVRVYEALTEVVPAWAQGCPVRSEAHRGMRYQKF